MYLITNHGLEVLEKKGLKKNLDDSFPDLEDYYLRGHVFDDDIEEYAQEHQIPDLQERIEADSEYLKNESFIINSEIILNLLKEKLPKNLQNDIKQSISAYYIYYNKILKGFRTQRYFWRDDKFLTELYSDIHGDMQIRQYDINTDLETEQDLFNYMPLVKKVNPNIINAYYDEFIPTLIHFITFCCQIGKKVPFKDNWEEVFFNGNFTAEKPGEVAKSDIDYLKSAKNKEESSMIFVLPFIDNPLKHVDPKKNIYIVHPIYSSGGYTSRPFIEGNELVYLHPKEDGIKVEPIIKQGWGNPSVRFNYDQTENAIEGIVKVIQKGGSRSPQEDCGLVFKHFPYERFKEIL